MGVLSMQEIIRQILAILTRAPKPVTSAQLADALGVSVRTIMNYMGKISSSQPGLIVSSRQGYKLTAGCSHEALLKEADFDIPQDRLDKILLRLLMQEPEPADLQELAELAMVSYESIRRDMALLKPRLAGHGLVLRLYRHKVTLAGQEQNKRNLLSYLIYKRESQGRPSLNKLQELFPDFPVEKLQDALFSLCRTRNYFVNEVLWPTLMRDILVMLHRRSRGFTLAEEGTETNPRHLVISQAAVRLLTECCQVSLGTSEQLYLHKLFSCFLLPYDLGHLSYEKLSTRLTPRILKIMEKLFEQLKQDLPFFPMDDDFKVRLALNVDNLLARHALGCLSTNPQKEDIKETSPFGTECTRHIMRRLSELTGHRFLEDDAAYIAVHTVMALERVRRDERLACGLFIPRYFDYHDSLRRSIQLHFDQELQITAISERYADTARLLASDIVLSVAPPPPKFPYAWVCIPPLLRSEKIQEIRLHIERVQQAKQEEKLRNLLLAVGSEHRFCRLPSSRENTPQNLFALLQKLLGHTSEIYYHPDSVIYQHVVIMDFHWQNKEPSHMSAVIPGRPLKWQGKNVDILLAFSLRTEDWQDMMFLLDNLVRRLMEFKVRASLKKVQTFAELVNCVCKQDLG